MMNNELFERDEDIMCPFGGWEFNLEEPKVDEQSSDTPFGGYPFRW